MHGNGPSLTPDRLPTIRETLAELNLQPRRQLGQHFIHDLNFTRHLARTGGPLAGEIVLEVGSGPGGLTRGLLMEGAERVVAVERDRRCLPALEAIAAHWPGRLEIINQDALDLDVSAASPQPTKIIANLPYNVAAPLIVRWLATAAWPPWWRSATLMVQLEMGQRIVAESATRSYGRLSVLAQWRTRAKLIMSVPPEVFVPKPRVDSCLIQLVPRDDPIAGFTVNNLERITAAAFGGRRKMIRRSLMQLVDDPMPLLAAAGIDPTQRADAIPVTGYAAITREYENMQDAPPCSS